MGTGDTVRGTVNANPSLTDRSEVDLARVAAAAASFVAAYLDQARKNDSKATQLTMMSLNCLIDEVGKVVERVVKASNRGEA